MLSDVENKLLSFEHPVLISENVKDLITHLLDRNLIVDFH
jgi:hypothetical protein